MITIRKSILACLAFLCTASFLSAQAVIAQAAATPPIKASRVKVSFLLLHEKYEGMDVALVGEGDADPLGPIHVHGSDFSESLTVSRGIYKIVHAPNSSEKVKKKPLCVIDLSGIKSNRVLVLLEPHNKIFKPQFINPADKKFTVNSTLFFNTTDLPIATEMGGVKSLIAPHSNTLSSAPERANLPYYEVSFFYPEADGSPRKFESTRWPFRGRGRNYAFFFVNPVTQGVSCRTVEEIVSFEPKD